MKNYKKRVFVFLISILSFLSVINFLIGDQKIFLFINKNLANPILDFFVLKIFIPLFFFLAIFPIFLIFSKKEKNLGFFSLFSGPFSYFLGNLIKLLFKFPRPADLIEARTIGLFHVSPYSFPSTTTMLAFGLAIPILLKKKKMGSFLLFLSFLVGFSVIYTGYHFPKDVIAGIFFTILVCYFLNSIYERFSL